MQNIEHKKWAIAIAERISDEWCGRQDFEEDACLLRDVLIELFIENPAQCKKLIGSGIIEENYFSKID